MPKSLLRLCEAHLTPQARILNLGGKGAELVRDCKRVFVPVAAAVE